MNRALRAGARAVAIVAVALASLTACAASEPIAVSADTVVVDVRTPDEFADGHLEGAVNIDVSAADFGDRIALLDPAADYVVYCRSGNRSASAVAAMRGAGFTAVTDAGGISAASSATGLDIVTGLDVVTGVAP